MTAVMVEWESGEQWFCEWDGSHYVCEHPTPTEPECPGCLEQRLTATIKERDDLLEQIRDREQSDRIAAYDRMERDG